jgi:hypothetical protein
MRHRGSDRTWRIVLGFALAAVLLPLECEPAEARGIKVRVRTSPTAHYKADDPSAAKSGFSRRVRIRTNSGSGSSGGDGREDDQKARARSPSAAAAAAARARTALESEKAVQAAKGHPAATAPQPLPLAKTMDYGNGVTCIAGC